MRDLHEDLLERWSQEQHHQGQCFIKDGIIDVDRWQSADPKVLFLLKEARHCGKGTWDLRKYLREKAPSEATWRNAAYWCYAIHHIRRGKLPGRPFLSDRKVEYDKAVEALRSSAVVNIKKSKGKSTSALKDIERYARRDKPYIQQQIKLIKPDVVICGYTWQFVEDWWPDKKSIYDGTWRVRQVVFIDFWHPSYRVSGDLKYYALAAMLHFSNALAKYAWKRQPKCGLDD
jgi:hypothetical protein